MVRAAREDSDTPKCYAQKAPGRRDGGFALTLLLFCAKLINTGR